MERHLLIIDQYKLQPGDRLIAPKSIAGLVQHHALYLGWIRGNYYFIENKDNIGVQLVLAEQFLTENPTFKIVRFQPSYSYSRNDLINFALSFLGRKYDLANYNCETFCNEVVYGKAESKQVQNAVGAMVLVLLIVLAFRTSN